MRQFHGPTSQEMMDRCINRVTNRLVLSMRLEARHLAQIHRPETNAKQVGTWKHNNDSSTAMSRDVMYRAGPAFLLSQLSDDTIAVL